MENIKQWYDGLVEREQRLLMIAAVFIGIGLLYWLIWSPLNHAITLQEKRFIAQQQLQAFVAQQALKVNRLQSIGGETTLSGSLTQAVNNTASRSNIALTRMQPRGDEVQVWIDEVAFTSFMVWLNRLEETGIRVLQVDMTETAKPGVVKIRRLELGKA